MCVNVAYKILSMMELGRTCMYLPIMEEINFYVYIHVDVSVTEVGSTCYELTNKGLLLEKLGNHVFVNLHL